MHIYAYMLHWIISVKVVLGPNKIINMKILRFLFLFTICLLSDNPSLWF